MASLTVKTRAEIDLMKAAGAIVKGTLELMEKHAKPGVTTLELDAIAEDYIRSQGAIPSFLNYAGYPKSICTSVNEQVVHGIPDGYRLKEGDILSVDVGAVKNGFHGDAARTFPVGAISAQAQRLIDVTRECFFLGIAQAKAGNHLSDVSRAIEGHAHEAGFGVVRDLVGHGIGRDMHEPPDVPNYVDPRRGRGLRLLPGMTIAVEPMITAGDWRVLTKANGWTVVTRDNSLSAHYENTIAITDGEPELLTL